MSAFGVKRDLVAARRAVQAEMNSEAQGGGRGARGLSSEGYLGGYRNALDDVLLVLNGAPPSSAHARFWKRWFERASEPRP